MTLRSTRHYASLALLLLSLAACAGPATPPAAIEPAPNSTAPTLAPSDSNQDPDDTKTAVDPKAIAPETAALTPSPASGSSVNAQAPQAGASEQIAATIYTIDQRCEELLPRPVNVDAQTPIDAIVGEVIAAQSMPQFELDGYSVNFNPSTGVVTIDFQVNSRSPRHLESLSACEQLALFGGLKESLTTSDRWDINEVRFTQQGEEVLL